MKQRAMIVDDPTETVASIQEFLSSKEIASLVLSGNGIASYLWAEKFSIAFVNIQTRSWDAIEVIRRIRPSGVNQQTPLVLVTDDEDPGALSAGFEAGA